MSREIVVATANDGTHVRHVLEVFEDHGKWTSTLVRVDEQGRTMPGTVAPRFYGLSAEQARRRMLAVLEDQYDDVRTEPG